MQRRFRSRSLTLRSTWWRKLALITAGVIAIFVPYKMLTNSASRSTGESNTLVLPPPRNKEFDDYLEIEVDSLIKTHAKSHKVLEEWAKVSYILADRLGDQQEAAEETIKILRRILREESTEAPDIEEAIERVKFYLPWLKMKKHQPDSWPPFKAWFKSARKVSSKVEAPKTKP